MPLPKSATKKQRSAARLQRMHTRNEAIKHFGKKAVKGKHVHHKNGNKQDNRKNNLKLEDPKTHGSKHGRGNPGSVKTEIKFKFKTFNKKIWGIKS